MGNGFPVVDKEGGRGNSFFSFCLKHLLHGPSSETKGNPNPTGSKKEGAPCRSLCEFQHVIYLIVWFFRC